MLHDLRELLAEQVDNLKQLEEIMHRQRESLVERDIAGIVESVTEQGRCLERVQRMESDRTRLIARLSSVLGFPSARPTLTELTESPTDTASGGQPPAQPDSAGGGPAGGPTGGPAGGPP